MEENCETQHEPTTQEPIETDGATVIDPNGDIPHNTGIAGPDEDTEDDGA